MHKADRLIDRLLREREDVTPDPKGDLLRLWRHYLSKRTWPIVIGMLFTLVLSAQQMGFALTWRFLFDEALNQGHGIAEGMQDVRMRNVWLYVIMTSGIWGAWFILRIGRDWFVFRAGKELVYTMRQQLHEKLQRLHLYYFERTPTGRILSRVMDDVNVILTWVVQQSLMLLQAGGGAVLSIGLLFYLNRHIALLVVGFIPVYFVLFFLLRRRIRQANTARRSLVAKQYARASERINSIPVVKTFTRERHECSVFGSLTVQDARVGIRLEQYNQLLGLGAGLLTAGLFALVIFLSAGAMRQGHMSVGDFVAFVQAMGSAVMSIERISMLIVRTQETCVVIRRVFSLIDEPEEVESGPTQLQGIRHGVAFDKVTFTYPGQYRPALSRVSFEVHAGEKIALMGPSGSGKSTILWLLLRFYDPQQGLISIDGTDIRDIDISSLRTHICMVQQEPTIFSGSLRDNIAYGREASDTSSIQEAAQMAEIHDFASSLTHGYDTPVGESGVTLSGGQKQRVALAASLLTEPEILLLDDTTSALDAQTEKRIQQTLHTVLQHKTSMVITHRIATAAVCSRIIVLEDGHITQQGTHRELQKHPGFYRRICEQQNRAADIDDTPAC